MTASRRLFHFPWLVVSLLLASMGAGGASEIDEAIDAWMEPIADHLEGLVFVSVPVGGDVSLPIVLAVLGGTAIFLTLFFGFINLRAFGVAIRTARGKYTDPDAPGQISHFQALTTALSATVGLGNIAGVAVAVGMGGPGATFWMILMGLCGMTTKFCECTLGVKYRVIDEKGKAHGGGMYYLARGLAERGLGPFGSFLGIFFALMCIGGTLGAGNMFQVNQAYSQFSGTFGVFQEHPSIFGIILAVLVGLVIIGGIVSIARVTSFLVPIMCGIYVLAALVIIFTNLDKVPDAFGQIISGAFSPEAVGGGLVGVLIQGIKRAAFSNEAGVGSAPIAHSAVKTDRPASEGLVALLEPFTDTVVVCTMTALVLVITGTWKVDGVVEAEELSLRAAPKVEAVETGTVAKGDELRLLDKKDGWGQVWQKDADPVWINLEGVRTIEGIEKTSAGFGQRIGWFPKLLAIAVLLFAFSTMISWSYYGEQAVIFLFGKRIPAVVLVYKVIFCLFVIVGVSASLGNVIRVSDAMIFAMVLPNMIGLYILLPVVRKELNSYMEHVRSVDGKK
ncbi:MAG: alanine:cation symporter family protein [Akkermansiaceae bacterium]|nr:alanine:cation symporter family protein [Akkermansiaceae bacterium]